MKRYLLLVPLLVLSTLQPAPAGIFFNKRPEVKPEERVPQLILIVQTDGDEGKRADAAEELRRFDPVAFPQIVPVLIGVLQNDKRPSVRVEAAQSLGRMRPVSQVAGRALEQAKEDSSLRVRIQARSSLIQYHWAGYRRSKEAPPPPQTTEPPLIPEAREGTPGGNRLLPTPRGPLPPPVRTRTYPAPGSSVPLPRLRPVPGTPAQPRRNEPPIAPGEGPRLGSPGG